MCNSFGAVRTDLTETHREPLRSIFSAPRTQYGVLNEPSKPTTSQGTSQRGTKRVQHMGMPSSGERTCVCFVASTPSDFPHRPTTRIYIPKAIPIPKNKEKKKTYRYRYRRTSAPTTPLHTFQLGREGGD